ncbi:Quinone oxidoreductase 2 [Halioglobus japonicus]|nr:Quinone oxidoreductase 2 [Halioglobus japonicus]
MKIAVTAVTGQLGTAIALSLSQLTDTNNIVGVARNPQKARHLGIEVRAGDYNKREEMEAALQGLDTLLLVSGMDAPDKRIEQHRNVLQAARDAGVSKVVYTSIQGAEQGTAFSEIVQSNRQTEADVSSSGLDWVIGRNGIYIEPDIEYIDNYRERGEIANCAADGRCGYTTRPELAYAYARMLLEPNHSRHTYNLHGEAITQAQLAGYLNRAFGTQLEYRSMSVEAYRQERIAELGEFMGTVIAGIYEGIRNGYVDNNSDYARAAGRPHLSWERFFADIRSKSMMSQG